MLITLKDLLIKRFLTMTRTTIQPLSLRILGWEASGLRIPDFKFKLDGSGSIPRVTLIQGPNGTAKTTTLSLLRAALSGEAVNWGPEKVTQFSRKDSETGECLISFGHFFVRCLCGNQPYTFSLKFDFTNNSCRYETTTPQGLIEGFRPAPALRPFLNEFFVRLFVFDGEEAQALSDQSQTKAAQAIEVAHRIYLVSKMKQYVEAYYKGAVGKLSGNSKVVQGKFTRLNELENYYRIRKEEMTKVLRDVQEAEAKFKRLDALWNEKFARIPQDRDKLVRHTEILNQAEENLRNQLLVVSSLSLNPLSLSASLSIRLGIFQSGLEKAKLPESTAREFFSDLAEQEICICGRPIGSAEKAHIHESAKSHLATDAVQVLNQIKAQIRTSIESDTPLSSILNDALSKYTELNDERQRAWDDLEFIKQNVSKDDPDLKRTKDDLAFAKDDYQKLTRQLDKYEVVHCTMPDSDTLSVETLRRRLTEARDAYAAAVNAKNLVDKKNTLLNLLDEVVVLARKRVTDDTILNTNKLLRDIIPLNQIFVESIDTRLALKNASGASMGETLVVAYAFLTSLLTASSGVSMPFIVDSPAGALGGAVRKEIGKVLPGMSEQAILFVLDKEIDDFVSPLEDSVTQLLGSGDHVRFLTMFKNGHVNVGLYPAGSTFVTGCGRGVLVDDRSFFLNFS